jgi:hypothetical protein
MASQANAGGNSHEQSFGRPQLCLSDSLQGEMLMTPRNAMKVSRFNNRSLVQFGNARHSDEVAKAELKVS